MDIIYGIDMGGTNTKIAACDLGGNLLKSKLKFKPSIALIIMLLLP